MEKQNDELFCNCKGNDYNITFLMKISILFFTLQRLTSRVWMYEKLRKLFCLSQAFSSQKHLHWDFFRVLKRSEKCSQMRHNHNSSLKATKNECKNPVKNRKGENITTSETVQSYFTKGSKAPVFLLTEYVDDILLWFYKFILE